MEHDPRLRLMFAEENATIAAASLRVPTPLFSGGVSPYLTQRIARRLAAIVDNAEMRHLPDAGHMLPLSHASIINPEIVSHIARADDSRDCRWLNYIEDSEPPLRFEPRALADGVGSGKA